MRILAHEFHWVEVAIRPKAIRSNQKRNPFSVEKQCWADAA